MSVNLKYNAYRVKRSEYPHIRMDDLAAGDSSETKDERQSPLKNKNVTDPISGKRFDSGTKQRRVFPEWFHCGHRAMRRDLCV